MEGVVFAIGSGAGLTLALVLMASIREGIELADVPFVPLRRLFPRELGRLPGRFTALVQQYRGVVAELSAPPAGLRLAPPLIVTGSPASTVWSPPASAVGKPIVG